MTSIRELKQQKVTLFNQAKAIKDTADRDKRAMSQEEQNNWDAIMTQWTDLKRDIDQRERLDAMGAEIETRDNTATRNDPDEGNPDARGKLDLTNISTRYHAALREMHQRGDVRMKADYRGVMNPFLRNNVLPNVELRDLQMTEGPKGGYIAPPPQFVAGLLQALDADIFFRQQGWATVLPLTSDSGYEASLDADPDDFEWTTEIAEITDDTSMKFGKRELKPTALRKAIKLSNKLLRLAPSAEDIAMERMRYKLGVTMEKAYQTGTGAKQPLGVFTASNDGIPTSRDISTDNTVTAMTFKGLRNAKYALKNKYWREAKWLFHQDAIKQIANIEDDNGYPVLAESVTVNEPDTLMGVPYYMSEFTPNTFTTGLYVGIIGAFRFYHIADCLTMYIQRINELYSRTGQTGFHVELYTDGMPVLSEAFARVKLA